MENLRLGKCVFVLLISVVMMINMMSTAVYAYELSDWEESQGCKNILDCE